MNQDQIKEKLLRLETPDTDFSVIFSGKSSAKVNGLYKIEAREIILHNKNFHSDEELVYTAIHEYAHHLLCEKSASLPNSRTHTVQFWSKFHELLEKAERVGIYKNIFETEPDFIKLETEIRRLIPQNGSIFVELGRLIKEAQDLCGKHHVRFEDFVDRALGLPRKTAFAAVQAYSYNLPPDIGWDNLTLLSGIDSDDKREECMTAIREGKSHEQLRNMIRPSSRGDSPAAVLVKEKQRLERTIHYLTNKLDVVERKIRELEKES